MTHDFAHLMACVDKHCPICNEETMDERKPNKDSVEEFTAKFWPWLLHTQAGQFARWAGQRQWTEKKWRLPDATDGYRPELHD